MGGVSSGPHRSYKLTMHWLLHLLVDAFLLSLLVSAYCIYQTHRRKQVEYARVQLYEDADKPCAPPLLRPALGSNSSPVAPPRAPSTAPAVCGGTPEVGGWTDPDDRDDEPLTSIATTVPSHHTPLANPPPRGAASKKSGRSGKKMKRLRADADLQDADDVAAVSPTVEAVRPAPAARAEHRAPPQLGSAAAGLLRPCPEVEAVVAWVPHRLSLPPAVPADMVRYLCAFRQEQVQALINKELEDI